jgi:hypothetical protein
MGQVAQVVLDLAEGLGLGEVDETLSHVAEDLVGLGAEFDFCPFQESAKPRKQRENKAIWLFENPVSHGGVQKVLRLSLSAHSAEP